MYHIVHVTPEAPDLATALGRNASEEGTGEVEVEEVEEEVEVVVLT